MRLELPSGLREVHRMTIPVRWGDLDAMGHVNNTIYFRYFETLRIDWLARQGSAPTADGIGPLMANGFCNFRRQVEYPCDLLARHFVGRLGTTSVDTYFTLCTAEAPDQVCADGGATLVWVDFPRQRPVPLPQWLRELCAA